MISSKDSSKITIAAEELMKVAMSHVEAISLTIGQETAENLKNLSIESSSIENSIHDLQNSMDAKLNTLNQSISNLKEEIALQSKNQTLQWAIENQKLLSNDLYNYALVKEILISFRKGMGHLLPNRSIKYYGPNGIENVKKGEALFRDAISNQIHELLGQKPRIELNEDGEYIIYYS